MPFILKFHADSTTGLIAVCDLCGKEVKAAEANVVWKPGKEVPGKTTHTFLILCQGTCDRIHEQKRGHHYWQELDVAIGYLINNTKTDLKEVWRKMRLLVDIG